EGLGYFRLYRSTGYNLCSMDQIRLEASTSFSIRTYGPWEQNGSKFLECDYYKYRSLVKLNQELGMEYRLSQLHLLTPEQQQTILIKRPLTTYNITKYLMEMSNSKVVTYITRENLERVV